MGSRTKRKEKEQFEYDKARYGTFVANVLVRQPALRDITLSILKQKGSPFLLLWSNRGFRRSSMRALRYKQHINRQNINKYFIQ